MLHVSRQERPSAHLATPIREASAHSWKHKKLKPVGSPNPSFTESTTTATSASREIGTQSGSRAQELDTSTYIVVPSSSSWPEATIHPTATNHHASPTTVVPWNPLQHDMPTQPVSPGLPLANQRTPPTHERKTTHARLHKPLTLNHEHYQPLSHHTHITLAEGCPQRYPCHRRRPRLHLRRRQTPALSAQTR